MCLAAPARVISIADREAVVDYNGVRTTARLDTLIEPLAPGDYVLIHTGFAIRRLSPEDGEATLRLFDELANSLDVNNVSSYENAEHSRVGPDSAVSDREAASSSDEANPDQQAEPSSGRSAEQSRVGYEPQTHPESDS